jgi:hypothetical protein
MLVQVVEEIEREDFRRFAAAIYGRGFVRLYAEHLGIDPLPLVKEFGELYAGARRPKIATRVLQTVPEQPATPAPPAAPSAPAATAELKPPAPADAPPAPAAAHRPPAAPEAAEEIFAPEQQEPSPAQAAPDNDLPDARGPDLDLFSAMASHAFGGEPVQTPTRREQRPAAATSQRQSAPEESSERPLLVSALTGQGQSRRLRLAGRLNGWRDRLTDMLPAPCRAQPLLSGAAALAILALLIAGAIWLARRPPGGGAATPAGNAAAPAHDIRLLPPPETYVD